jgi:hypothetical protein
MASRTHPLHRHTHTHTPTHTHTHTVLTANSSSSCVGSAPAVVTNNTGVPGPVSFTYAWACVARMLEGCHRDVTSVSRMLQVCECTSAWKFMGGGDTEDTPTASHTYTWWGYWIRE